MGVSISSHSSLAPISLASTIIGFVSFAVTVTTLLRVSWDNISTIHAAPEEIPDMLGNLRAGLDEERRHIRRALRWQRRRRRSASAKRGGEKDPTRTTRDDESTDRTILTLRDTVRHMLRRFHELERPFLRVQPNDNRKVHRRGALDNDDWDTDGLAWYDAETDEASYANDSTYKKCGMRERWLWLRRKSDCSSLSVGLNRLQIRRIAKETGDIRMAISHMERDWRHLDDRMWGLENRLSRVVGVRRVE